VARTLIDGADQVQSGTITRGDINVTVSGSAVIAKIIPGAGISITQTGVDNGTGDVTISSFLTSAIFLTWFNSLSTTLPSTSGVPWNNGGIPSVS
jgi:hypothetical protein